MIRVWLLASASRRSPMPIQSVAAQPPANGGSTSTTAPSGIVSSGERVRPSTRNEDAATTVDSSGRATKSIRSSCKVRAEDNSSGCPAARRAPAQNRTVTLTRSAAQPCSSGLMGWSLAAVWLSCWCPRSSICPSLSATDLILSEYLPPVARSSSRRRRIATRSTIWASSSSASARRPTRARSM